MTISQAFEGHNLSRQYIGCLEYRSAVIEKQENIKFEVGVREPVLKASESKMARTIAVNPFTGMPLMPAFPVHAMAMKEAYAEKLRAAITRIDPAIRDFFDLYYAVRKIGLDIADPDFVRMLKSKLEVPGNAPVDVSEERKLELHRQLEGRLKPVLRAADFARFSLDEAFELASNAARTVSV
jgi:predicted nucleotidyltransferase component of viral defense system